MTLKTNAEFYPLSPMQRGMLFHSLYAPASGLYVEQLRCTLCGALDVGAFERAWRRVVERHPILRTSFAGERLREPVQVVARQVALPIIQHDWRALAPAEQELRLAAFLESDRARGFKLAEAPLLRLALLRLADDACWFVWTYHHALLDGWSGPLLLQEVFALYEAFRLGQELELPQRRPFRDYIVWLRRQDHAAAETFWRRAMAGLTAPTSLQLARADGGPAPVAGEAGAAEEEALLSRASTQALRALARGHGLTINTLVAGAWALLLSRYSGEEEVVFGATVSGRPADLPGAEEMIGLFINTLPVRVAVPPEAELIPWLQALQAHQAELRQYEYSSLVEIQGWSEVPRGVPLFESILVFENYPVGEALREQGGSLEIADVQSQEQTNYPLTVVSGPGDELELKISYDRGRFDAATVRRMLGHLVTLLEAMAADPRRSLAALPLLTAAERRQVLVEWNDTAAPFPSDTCVHRLFEAQVARTPEAVALSFGNDQLTYAELNGRANQLARHLRRLGVGPEVLVGICLERSPEQIISLLGVLKAGGAYIPLDPAYPPERLRFMLDDARPLALITSRPIAARLFAGQGQPEAGHLPAIVAVEADWPLPARDEVGDLDLFVAPANLAYVIYTSGSTGRPKGVLLEHRGLCNFAQAYSRDLGIGPGTRVLQFSSFSFDASVAETFGSLLYGATLCLASQEELMSAHELVRLLRDQAISTVLLPPSLLALLPEDELPALRTLLSGGESCPVEVAARWSRGRRFFNAYGPTETTVGPCWHEVRQLAEDAASVPIGRPIANAQIYLLDRAMQPVPVGAPGELYVGGAGLARGYLNRPELTAERFVVLDAGLWGPELPPAPLRLYRTGDLARFRADGLIEFLGRIDHQVKLRGFRIELGEIESVLRRHPAVRAAAAIVREDTPGQQRLVAYVTLDPGVSVATAALREHLKQLLPDYMLPAAIVALAALPMTPSGKLDRRALPAPAGERSEPGDYVRPGDELEEALVIIWEALLDVRPIGVHDDFFTLGGHSLLAVRLLAQVEQRLGATPGLASLFQEPTVAGLAAAIRRQTGQAAGSALVTLRAGGSARPLFLIHPSGGSVHWYTDLARLLGDDQPVYGLQARGLDGTEELHTSIEDMAAYYIAALRGVQPEGPYRIGGWSLGVAPAFEVARQLHAAGQQVELLAMLDQGPLLLGDEPEDDTAFLLDVFDRQLPLSEDFLRKLAPAERMAAVLHEARRRDMVPPDITLAQFQRFIEMLATHSRAWRAYTPQPYSGRITLFRADGSTGPAPVGDEPRTLGRRLRGAGQRLSSLLRGLNAPARHSDEAASEPDLGWGLLAGGGVEVYSVPGDHRSMLAEPHVHVLARHLKACMAELHQAEYAA